MSAAPRINTAQMVRDRLTMPEVIRRYVTTDIRRDRIKCPLHDGKDFNMRVYKTGAHCFVCGENVNVIDMTMALFGLTLPDAIRKLDEDFNLGVDVRKLTPVQRTQIAQADAVRRSEAAEAQRARELKDWYHRMYVRVLWATRERMRVIHPSRPEWWDLLKIEIEALREIDALEGRLF